MEKRQIIFWLFVPADQETTKTIEPGMRPLNDPPSCTISRNGGFLCFFFTTTANMIEIAAFSHQNAHELVVIRRVQTQMLGMFFTWFWASDDDAVERGAQQFAVVPIGSIDHHRQRAT